MTLTPEDIQTTQFHVRFRGFDVEEVDAFLEKVAEELLAANEENKLLAEKVETLTEEMASYHDKEKTLQNVIFSAQNIADEMKEKSRNESEEIVNNAREEADALRRDAAAEIVGLEKELDRLNGLRSQAKDELRSMLQAYLARIEEGTGESTAVFRESREAESVEFAAGVSGEVSEIVPEIEDLAAETSQETIEEKEPEQADFAAEESLEVPEEFAAEKEGFVVTELESEDESRAETDDLSDLYEKIDLTDDTFLGSEQEEYEAGEETGEQDEDVDVSGLLAMGGEEEEEEEEEELRVLPDLEGDMVFTLEDPLDDNEPVVDFGEPEKDSDKKQETDTE